MSEKHPPIPEGWRLARRVTATVDMQCALPTDDRWRDVVRLDGRGTDGEGRCVFHPHMGTGDKKTHMTTRYALKPKKTTYLVDLTETGAADLRGFGYALTPHTP